ncbi:protein-disulfide reductase DsbD domain-containing protein [Paeniroseomonas aquatica]|uniref:protein-disulfide reductase DsbD domain-containing protein n=1 Tax=Paeniroseomonas aquatica TaxID=373043 RepID=UPI00360A2445
MRPLLLLLAILLGPVPARAAESPAVRSPRATATLVADHQAVAPGEAFQLGLRLRLAPGWHTYWRNPGDAGAPPELLLTLPEGVTAGPIQWPAPQRIPTGPLVSYGYEQEVLLPLRVALPAGGPAPAGPLTIEAEASWLVCAEICIPEEGRFRLDLPVAAAGRLDAGLAPLFTRAEAALPGPRPGRPGPPSPAPAPASPSRGRRSRPPPCARRPSSRPRTGCSTMPRRSRCGCATAAPPSASARARAPPPRPASRGWSC